MILFVSGGEDRACGYNITEKFDPKTDTWTFAPSMKRRRAGAGIAVCDGKIYVAGTLYKKIILKLKFMIQQYVDSFFLACLEIVRHYISFVQN